PAAALLLFQMMPLDAPLEETDWKVKVPSELTKFTAVDAPVDIMMPFTVSPVAVFADSVPVSVGVLAVFPVTVNMPPTLSVAPAPISDWFVFNAQAPVVLFEPCAM